MAVNASTEAFLRQLPHSCYPHLIPQIPNSYHYQPHLAAGIVFCILFASSLIGHLIQVGRLRQWTSLVLAAGALTEVIGWAGRTWSAKCPYQHDAFLMQITTLIIAPTLFAAALYITLANIIRTIGPESSYLSPKTYAIVFCTCDVISLVVQAGGGGLASEASDKLNGNTKPGTNTMVAGIGFQLGTMTVFALLFVDFLRRIRSSRLTRKQKSVLLAMVISFTMIYIRSIYRTVELAQGWTGNLITHEGYFLGLDAAVMVIAVGIFNVVDPAVLLERGSPSHEHSPAEENHADESIKDLH